LPLAAPAAPPQAVAPPSSAPGATFTTAAVPEAIDRNLPADDRRLQVEAAIETPEPAPEVIPLPPPKPRRVASIPVPRPRPHLDGDDAPPQERSLLDVLFNRQR
jgi:hypothetical protein